MAAAEAIAEPAIEQVEVRRKKQKSKRKEDLSRLPKRIEKHELFLGQLMLFNIFTSNKRPSKWKANFNEDDALLCALDRIFDDAIVFNIKGEGYRGKRLETLALQTSRVKAP